LIGQNSGRLEFEDLDLSLSCSLDINTCARSELTISNSGSFTDTWKPTDKFGTDCPSPPRGVWIGMNELFDSKSSYNPLRSHRPPLRLAPSNAECIVRGKCGYDI
jgi:hypothetical protein